MERFYAAQLARRYYDNSGVARGENQQASVTCMTQNIVMSYEITYKFPKNPEEKKEKQKNGRENTRLVRWHVGRTQGLEAEQPGLAAGTGSSLSNADVRGPGAPVWADRRELTSSPDAVARSSAAGAAS